jgi:hypothetical protein
MIINSINPKGTATKLGLFTGFLVLAITAIFAASMENATFADTSMLKGQENAVTGEVITVENLNHLDMVTLRSEEIGKFPNDRLNTFLNRDSVVTVCNVSEPSRDIGVGRNVMVTYHEVRGLLPVADSVREQC